MTIQSIFRYIDVLAVSNKKAMQQKEFSFLQDNDRLAMKLDKILFIYAYSKVIF
jgi:hypothetical protein